MSQFAPGIPGGSLPGESWPPPVNAVRQLAVDAALATLGEDANYRERGETFDWAIRVKIERAEHVATGNFYDQGLSDPFYFPREPTSGDTITIGERVWQVNEASSEGGRILLSLERMTR